MEHQIEIAEAMYYLRDIPFGEWIRIDDIPRDIVTEVINLIDEGYRWKYTYCEFGWSFRKALKYERSEHGNVGNPKDNRGMKREPKIKIL